MSTKKTDKSSTATKKRYTGFTADEKAAMADRVREQKLAAAKADGEQELLAKVAAMPEPDRSMAKRIHAIVTASAPNLSPGTWYGMPAYANKEGKFVCFFKPASKFKARYATFEFNDAAHLDEGAMWPIGYALMKLTETDEKRIAAIVKKAAD